MPTSIFCGPRNGKELAFTRCPEGRAGTGSEERAALTLSGLTFVLAENEPPNS
jgi:hypothetical protein